MKISQGKVSKSQGLKKKARAKLDRDVSDNKRKNLRKCWIADPDANDEVKGWHLILVLSMVPIAHTITFILKEIARKSRWQRREITEVSSCS